MTPIPTKFYTSGFAQRVHEHYARMRDEAPVFRGKINRFTTAYLIARYDDCLNLLHDDRLIKNPRAAKNKSGRKSVMWMPPSMRPLMRNMLNSDEPDHRRLRNLVQKAFTPNMVEEMAARIEQITSDCLDRLSRKMKKDGHADFVSEFATPLPVTVICELIGIPAEDQGHVTKMTERLLSGFSVVGMLRAIPSIRSFSNYIRRLAIARRASPQNDLMSALAQAEDDGDRFTEDELIGMVFLLTVAGHETTVGLLSNALLALIDFPEQRKRLIDEPDLMDSAVEEFLRYDGPLATTEMAFARTDIEMHGVVIPQGATVLPAILSANRDEAAFPGADTLDIARTPNKHLAFGHGIHYCLGAPLARLETRTAMSMLLERFPDLQLVDPRHEIRYRSVFITHRPESLLVR